MSFHTFRDIDKSEDLQKLFKKEYGCDWDYYAEDCDIMPKKKNTHYNLSTIVYQCKKWVAIFGVMYAVVINVSPGV